MYSLRFTVRIYAYVYKEDMNSRVTSILYYIYDWIIIVNLPPEIVFDSYSKLSFKLITQLNRCTLSKQQYLKYVIIFVI